MIGVAWPPSCISTSPSPHNFLLLLLLLLAISHQRHQPPNNSPFPPQPPSPRPATLRDRSTSHHFPPPVRNCFITQVNYPSDCFLSPHPFRSLDSASRGALHQNPKLEQAEVYSHPFSLELLAKGARRRDGVARIRCCAVGINGKRGSLLLLSMSPQPELRPRLPFPAPLLLPPSFRKQPSPITGIAVSRFPEAYRPPSFLLFCCPSWLLARGLKTSITSHGIGGVAASLLHNKHLRQPFKLLR